MKRGEIRRQRRELDKKNKKYTLTNREIENIKLNAVTDAINLAFPMMCGLAGMVMRDKFDFGPIRMKRFMDHMFDAYESFAIGYVKLEDCIAVIKEETGYDIVDMMNQIDEKVAAICKESKILKDGKAV